MNSVERRGPLPPRYHPEILLLSVGLWPQLALISATAVFRSPPRSFRYLRWMSRLRRCSPNLPLAADNCESIFQLARVRDLASYGPALACESKGQEAACRESVGSG